MAKFWAPIPWLLEAAIILQIGLGKYIEAAVVAGLLLFNATLGFIQEGRAGAALAAMKKRLAPTALARRDGQWEEVAAADLVPGDVISLALGVLVPADACVCCPGQCWSTSRRSLANRFQSKPELGSQVYAAAGLVRRGQAIAEVTATGSKTFFGRAAELVRTAHSASTEQTAVFAVTRNLMILNGTVAALIIAYAYFLSLPLGDLTGLALTALLATVPVALPATFTLSAALSAQTLAERGVLLTRLSAAHEAAAMDVLCADKTGTLTRNELEVVEVKPLPGFDRARVLQLAALASSDADQDPIDAAIRDGCKVGRQRGRRAACPICTLRSHQQDRGGTRRRPRRQRAPHRQGRIRDHFQARANRRPDARHSLMPRRSGGIVLSRSPRALPTRYAWLASSRSAIRRARILRAAHRRAQRNGHPDRDGDGRTWR